MKTHAASRATYCTGTPYASGFQGAAIARQNDKPKRPLIFVRVSVS